MRASRRAVDPTDAVARALVDEPRLSDWAASAALGSFGSHLHAVDRPGRTAVFASGDGAAAMARGAGLILGGALSQLWIWPEASAPDEPVDRALVERECRSLRSEDRFLLLAGPESTPRSGGVGAPPSIEEVVGWASPADTVCIAHHEVGLAPGRISIAGGRSTVEVRTVCRPGAAVEEAMAAARRHGFATTLLSSSLQGSAASVGQALARVGLAMREGVGGLRFPACGIASGVFGAGPGRWGAVIDAARGVLGDAPDVSVECWSAGASAPDMAAVLVSHR